MNKREKEVGIVVDIADYIYNSLEKKLSAHDMRQMDGRGNSGDVAFKVDSMIEEEMHEYIRNTYPSCAYFSEDRGLVQFSTAPDYLLVIDPIDGTRPAVCQFEMACIAIALAPFKKKPQFKDIAVSIVKEIKTGTSFIGIDDKTYILGYLKQNIPVTINETVELSGSFGTLDVAGTPLGVLSGVVSGITDTSSISGGIFIFNSITYSLTRLLTGQLDFHVDVGGRLLNEDSGLTAAFCRAGDGVIVTLNQYDIAAVWHIVSNAGCIISDAYGDFLDEQPLVPSPDDPVLSCVAAVTRDLHKAIFKQLNFPSVLQKPRG